MENSNKKRSREEFADSSTPEEESKRFRPDLLIEILDDDDEEAEVDSLADVMKSLQDEISLPSSSPSPPMPRQHDLGYLLEASDDELGLPPTVGSETPTSDRRCDAVEVVDEEPDVAGLGRFWGFEEEMPCGYGDVGFGEPLNIGFDYEFEADSADYADYGDFLWRPEYQSAA